MARPHIIRCSYLLLESEAGGIRHMKQAWTEREVSLVPCELSADRDSLSQLGKIQMERSRDDFQTSDGAMMFVKEVSRHMDSVAEMRKSNMRLRWTRGVQENIGCPKN